MSFISLKNSFLEIWDEGINGVKLNQCSKPFSYQCLKTAVICYALLLNP